MSILFASCNRNDSQSNQTSLKETVKTSTLEVENQLSKVKKMSTEFLKKSSESLAKKKHNALKASVTRPAFYDLVAKPEDSEFGIAELPETGED